MTMGRQNNPKQKEHCWRYHRSWPQIILSKHSEKDSMVLVHKWTCAAINRIKNPAINAHTSGYLNLKKASRAFIGKGQTVEEMVKTQLNR